MLDDARKRAGGMLLKTTLELGAQIVKLHPSGVRLLKSVDVEANLPYAETGHRDHRLDIYRPKNASGALPALLYLHGGAFQILSKDTHWLMAGPFAREGFTVFNASYRLAPRHPYPAALEDAARAYEWVIANAHRYGGDVSRLVVVGESAGANLALGMTIAACFERKEPFARRVFDTGVVPKATLPMCGILQVSDCERFVRRKPKMRRILRDRITEVERRYLSGAAVETELADPLCILESDAVPVRPLPPMFAAAGTRDPILDDTRRLGAALNKRGVRNEIAIYPGEIHAFYAMSWRKASRDCWQRQFRFVTSASAAAP